MNFVEVPVTVKDSKGVLVAGLTFRDFKVYENNTREPLRLFTVDPAPLSIAFIIDQSLTSDVMAKVNNSLNAIQGALTPYDEVAVFSYNNGAQERTGGIQRDPGACAIDDRDCRARRLHSPALRIEPEGGGEAAAGRCWGW